MIDFQNVRNNVEPSATPPDKKPNEKELNLTPSSSKSPEPLPKQNNADANVPKVAIMAGTPRSTPDHVGNTWTPQRGTLQRASGGSWSWKPLATREVTEVTEVTETVVTEIVEVTQYPSGEKDGEPIITRTVKVLTDYGGELAEVNISILAVLLLPFQGRLVTNGDNPTFGNCWQIKRLNCPILEIFG